jgi:hypothetical protein
MRELTLPDASGTTLNRVFVFKTKEKSRDGRPYLAAFHESKIKSIKSIVGGHNCYLEINGIEVQGSFESFVEALGTRINVWEL